MPHFAQDFPTRRYPYPPTLREAGGFESSALAEADGLTAGVIHRLVLGVDAPPAVPMAPSDVETLLRDPFAKLALKKPPFPLSLRELLGVVDHFNNEPAGLPEQKSFVVADGGKIPWSEETATLNRFFRLAVVRARGGDVRLLISSSVAIDSHDADAFLQVIGWDPANEVYNYYERRGGTWIWAGNSWHALQAESRGKGPFDSHVNGSLVMKELKIPWSHWHSESSAIAEDALAPGDPLRTEPLFVDRTGAQVLQVGVVQPGIDRWTEARVRKTLLPGHCDPRPLVRHCLETTTVNLISADVASASVTADERLRLPPSFFLNVDALIDLLEIDADIGPVEVAGRLYLESLQEFEVVLHQGDFYWAGDTHFAFLVPEAAYEDLSVLDYLLRRGFLSPRFAACLVMVDYPNPVYSRRRERLARYVPFHAARAPQGWDVESQFVAAVQHAASGGPADSPEREFLAYWDLGEGGWKPHFQNLIETYFAAIQARADTRDGFFDFFRLAESRRRRFRRLPLAEFDLTLPQTNIPPGAPDLFMRSDGAIES